MKKFYRVLYRWGFKPSGPFGYRNATFVRLFLTACGGLFIASGMLDFPIRWYLVILSVVLVWSVFVLRICERATILLDLADLVLDGSLIVLLLQFTGKTQSPFAFMIYFWMMAMFATNVRGKSLRPMIIIACVAYLLLAAGSYGGERYFTFLLYHGIGMVLMILVANLFATELLRREIDILTGVYTRQTGMEWLEQWLETRSNFHLSFIDLIGFKNVNDVYGHRVGDEVLQEIGRRLRKSVREDDIVFRYGGDEFVIASAAPDLENRIHRCFEEPVVTSRGLHHVSARIGMASYKAPMSVDQLIREAEKKAYQSVNPSGDEHFMTELEEN